MKATGLLVVAGIAACALMTGSINGQGTGGDDRSQPTEQRPDAGETQRATTSDEALEQKAPDAPDNARPSAGTPGEAHARLDPLVGRWEADVKGWFVPGEDPVKSTGVARYEWVLRDPEAERGRFLRQEFRGEMMGGTFNGLAYWGHDNVNEVYTSVWMDSRNTGTTMSRGVYNEDEGAFHFAGRYTADDGQEVRLRIVLTIEDERRHRMKYYQSLPGQPEQKGLEVVYTRSRAGDERRRNDERPSTSPERSAPAGPGRR